MANVAGLDAFKQIHETIKKATGKKLKVAIIGTGWIAESHADGYLKMDDVEIVALADLIPEKAKAFAERFNLKNARIYDSDVSLLENEKELDGVSICVYNTQHAPCAIHALDAGVNVMLEKPFTVTLEEAIEVMRAEKRSGRILTIGFQPRMKLIEAVFRSAKTNQVVPFEEP